MKIVNISCVRKMWYRFLMKYFDFVWCVFFGLTWCFQYDGTRTNVLNVYVFGGGGAFDLVLMNNFLCVMLCACS